MLRRFTLLLTATVAMPLPAHAAIAAGGIDARTLLTLGMTLGIILFSAGSAIACLKATQAARRARDAALLEAERYRASEMALETILAAEPQVLMTWTNDGAPRLHVANLSPSFGVPTEAHRVFIFESWLDMPSAAALKDAVLRLAERGEAFNLMLRTRRQKHVEADGRATGGTLALKIRDLAGQRLELASLGDQQKKLDDEIAALRALVHKEANAKDRVQAELSTGIEARFRSFDRLATAFAVFDSDQRLAHYNQAYIALWQLDPDWLQTRPRDGEIIERLRQARRLPEKADFREWKRAWLSVYGTDVQKEEQWHLPDGRTLHVVADSAADGGVTYLYENVTERLQLESRYNALIHVQRETLDTLRDGVAVFAANGRLRLYNQAFAAIWKLEPRQLDGEPHIDDIIAACLPLYDEKQEWERTKAAITSIFAERRSYESQLDRPDGSVIACAALPLPDGGTLLTYSDVSDTKRVERALIDRNEALETADRIKTGFIGHVSYELRTPLTNIIGFTEMLASETVGPLEPKQREYLGDIRTSGRTLLAIIDDILDLATIDAGTFQLKLAPVNVRSVVDQAAHAVRERCKDHGVEIEVMIEPGIEAFIADGARVAQILYNLLANAVAFSPAGGRVTLSSKHQDAMLAFSVTDRGCGIPEEHQQAVFERFESRAKGSGHRGAGLGLSIVKSLVELHGGSVLLTSTPGRGTEVTALFPREQEGFTAPQADAGAEAAALRYGTARAG